MVLNFCKNCNLKITHEANIPWYHLATWDVNCYPDIVGSKEKATPKYEIRYKIFPGDKVKTPDGREGLVLKVDPNNRKALLQIGRETQWYNAYALDTLVYTD